MIPCRPCYYYDELVNDCVDPCHDFGASSFYCKGFGCPTTTVDTTNVQTWPVTVRQLPMTTAVLGHGSTLTIFVIIVVLIGSIVAGLLIWRYKKRSRLAVSNEGMTPHLF